MHFVSCDYGQGFPMVIMDFQGLSNGYQEFPVVIGGFQWLLVVFNGYQGFPMVIRSLQWPTDNL